MEFSLERSPSLPDLGWVARISEVECSILAGLGVEHGDCWAFEGVSCSDFSSGNFDQSGLVFGSGVRVRNGQVVIVSSSSTCDKVLIHAPAGREGLAWASNSLPALIAIAMPEMLERSDLNRWEIAGSITHGTVFPPKIHQIGEHKVVQVLRSNIQFDGLSPTRVTKDRTAPSFQSFDEYESFLKSSIECLAANALNRNRNRPLKFKVTISSGYDSVAAAALTANLPGIAGITFRTGKHGLNDSGVLAASQLKLPTKEFERLSRGSLLEDEVRLISSGTFNDLAFKAVGSALDNSVLFTGNHGGVWSKRLSLGNGSFVRDDSSGFGLSEWRLWHGVIHVPVPDIGAESEAFIKKISQSQEMNQWDHTGAGYDRPIPRRIAETAGVRRESFGQAKRAIAPLRTEIGMFSSEFLSLALHHGARKLVDGGPKNSWYALRLRTHLFLAPLLLLDLRKPLGLVYKIGKKSRLFPKGRFSEMQVRISKNQKQLMPNLNAVPIAMHTLATEIRKALNSAS